MKNRLIFVVILLIVSNLLFAQNSKFQKLSLKDSILYNNKVSYILSEIYADSNIVLDKNKLFNYNGAFLSFKDSLKFFDIKSLKQQINFYASNKLIKSYTPSDIFNFKRIKEVYNNEIPEENQIYFFSGIYFLQGNFASLYYIETMKINGGLIKALFTLDGFNLWAQLIDNGKWNFSTGEYTELFKSYGIKSDALDEKNLKTVKQVHHFFNK